MVRADTRLLATGRWILTGTDVSHSQVGLERNAISRTVPVSAAPRHQIGRQLATTGLARQRGQRGRDLQQLAEATLQLFSVSCGEVDNVILENTTYLVETRIERVDIPRLQFRIHRSADLLELVKRALVENDTQ